MSPLLPALQGTPVVSTGSLRLEKTSEIIEHGAPWHY